MSKSFFSISQYSSVYEDFIASISEDKELKAAVIVTVIKLREQGNKLGMPTSEHLEDGIFELRPRTSIRQARLLYFFKKTERTAVIVHCFIKKTQTVPRECIELAKKRRQELEALDLRKRGSNGKAY